MVVEKAIILLKETCPCGRSDKSNLHRIRRTVFMKTVLFWLPLKRYKCYNCKKNKWLLA